MKTINVSFKDSEIEAIEKTKKGQSWRKFILERAAIDSSNEIYTKGLNADALKGLCPEYDLSEGEIPRSLYEGFSLLSFFLVHFVHVPNMQLPMRKEEYAMWRKQIAELKKEKKER